MSYWHFALGIASTRMSGMFLVVAVPFSVTLFEVVVTNPNSQLCLVLFDVSLHSSGRGL